MDGAIRAAGRGEEFHKGRLRGRKDNSEGKTEGRKDWSERTSVRGEEEGDAATE